MPESENQTVASIVRSLTVGQFWGLLGAVCTLIVGSFALGFYLADLNRQNAVAKVQLNADRKIASHEGTVRGLEENLVKLEQEVSSLRVEEQSHKTALAFFKLKTDVQNALYTHVLADSPVSKAPLVRMICALMKSELSDTVTLASGNMRLSANDVRLLGGTEDQLGLFLRRNGVAVHKLAYSKYDQPFVQKELDRVKVTKSIVFADGSSISVPDEISLLVHSKECF